MTAPKYRSDIGRGELEAMKRDCIETMRGELGNLDFFVLGVEDCAEALREYGDYLTARELAACFKAAQKAGPHFMGSINDEDF